MIDQATIDRIFAATDIVEVISDFISVKKAGANYKALSPFTNEKTPSFVISPAKQIFKCFSSGLGGNAVSFIMEHEKFTYPEALKYLAKKYNIEIVEKEQSAEEIQKNNDRESMMIVNTFAQTYFSDMLHKHEEGKAIGLSYFKERGFHETTIEKFQLGYCLNAKDEFTQAALKNSYKLEFLTQTGLTIQKDNATYDRFKGRVMFPIHSLSGKVIGFGGRILKTDKKTAKYLNSPESEVYHKSEVLYGLYYAKNGIVKNEKCYIVEGYTDVLSMHQNGIDNVVASSGTALTSQQIRLINRFTNNTTIIFDGDEAGIKASLRGIDLILEEGLNVKVLLLPDGEDPDSFSKKNSLTELKEYIDKNEQDFISFKIRLLIGDAKDDPVKKAGLIQDIVRSIAVIPDKILRSVYIKDCSNLLKVDEQILYSEVYKNRMNKAEKNFQQYKKKEEVNLTSASVPAFVNKIFIEPLEKEIIRLLLMFSNENLIPVQDNDEEYITVVEYIINEIMNDELEFTNLIYKKIFQEFLEKLNSGEEIDSDHFINHTDDKIRNLAVDLISSKYTLSKVHNRKGMHIATEQMKLQEIVPKVLINYKTKVLELAQKENETKIKDAQKNNFNNEDMIQLMSMHKKISNTLMQISNNQGWVVLR